MKQIRQILTPVKILVALACIALGVMWFKYAPELRAPWKGYGVYGTGYGGYGTGYGGYGTGYGGYDTGYGGYGTGYVPPRETKPPPTPPFRTGYGSGGTKRPPTPPFATGSGTGGTKHPPTPPEPK